MGAQAFALLTNGILLEVGSPDHALTEALAGRCGVLRIARQPYGSFPLDYKVGP